MFLCGSIIPQRLKQIVFFKKGRRHVKLKGKNKNGVRVGRRVFLSTANFPVSACR